MKPSIPNLLRRTFFAAAGALLAFGYAVSSQAAQTVTLSGTTANTCTFSGQVQVDPTGALLITCNTSTPTSASFALSVPATLAINTTGNVQTTVTRSGGTGPLDVTYAVSSGTGSCTATSGTITIAEGDATPQPISISTTGSVGTCTVTLNGGSGNTTPGSPGTISVNDPNAPPPPSNGCPAPAANSVNLNMLFYTATKSVLMAPGQIAYTKVVPVPTGSAKYSVSYEWFQNTNTPGSISSEVSISKCPGVIDTTVPAGCYMSLPPSANLMNKMNIYEKPKTSAFFGWTDQATLGSKGCWVALADATAGTYYVNMRYNFSNCQITGGCGFNVGWIYGPE